MNRQPGKFLIAGFFLSLTLFLIGCADEADQKTAEADQAAADKTIVSVEAAIIEVSNLDITRTFSGELAGEKQADIKALVAEAVQEIHLTEGTAVKANQTIISLDPNGPSSGLTAARLLYLNSEKTFQKMSNLYQEGAISESSYDAARTAYEVDRANFESLRQLIEIRSPIAGVVTAIDVAVGEYVASGQKVATVAAVDKLRLTFAVNADEVGLFTKGAEVVISSDLSAWTAAGVVEASAGSANPDTRAFEVEAIIDNQAGYFRPGMFVHVDYLAERLEQVIVIDRSSVLIVNDIPVSFIIKNGLAVRIELTLGETVDGRQVVTAGLQAGDTLVTVGQAYLNDGDRLNLTRLNGR